jgi:sarcosine oxidase subunit gamma
MWTEGVCVVDLKAKTPCDGLVPLEKGTCRLTEVTPPVMSLLAPLPGAAPAVEAALQAAHGLGWPAPGETRRAGTAQILWFGRETALLCGVEPGADLGSHALVTDQSDSWAIVLLEGEAADDVLARLVPVDLRSLSHGGILRTMLGHMNVAIERRETGFAVFGFRSMAGTLVHEIADAMGSVAARAALG